MSNPPFNMVAAIRDKRDGRQLDEKTITQIVKGYVDDAIPDYQMSALLMAICLRGFSEEETLHLTQSMVASGDTFSPGVKLGRRIVDKHSTGGVGDKVSIALAPIVAACGVPLGKMSGRGLGHTGGTLDKLESIPGFSVDLTEPVFIEQLRNIGAAIAGQTGNLVPADKKLYALRDVTATVESIPLIAASIMSKKLASGADSIVLDVKVGSGAFMKELADARALADEMIAIGKGAGRDVRVLITDMSTPLGCAVGNALEIKEVVALLKGQGPADLYEIVVESAALLLTLSDLALNESEALSKVNEALSSGAAYDRYREWIRAQGGDPDTALALAPTQIVIEAETSGTLVEADALTIGRAAADLGAGRMVKDAQIDHGVGVVLHHDVGEEVKVGAPLATIYAADQAAGERAFHSVKAALTIDPTTRPYRRTVIIERRG